MCKNRFGKAAVFAGAFGVSGGAVIIQDFVVSRHKLWILTLHAVVGAAGRFLNIAGVGRNNGCIASIF